MEILDSILANASFIGGGIIIGIAGVIVAVFVLPGDPYDLPKGVRYEEKEPDPNDPMAPPKTAKCGTCKHIVEVGDMQKVEYYSWAMGLSHSVDYRYCNLCKKPYDRKRKSAGDATRYFKTIPETEIEVDEKGKEIKKK